MGIKNSDVMPTKIGPFASVSEASRALIQSGSATNFANDSFAASWEAWLKK